VNLAARVISNTRRYDHITPVLRELEWLPIKERVEMKIANFVFKCRAGLAPPYLSQSLTEYTPARQLRSSNSTAVLYELGSVRTVAGRRAWSVAGPRVWNSLPTELREGGISLELFVSQLKTTLIIQSLTPD